MFGMEKHEQNLAFDGSQGSADLKTFMVWARSSGFLFDKIELRESGTDERGCFAIKDIFPGEIFLRVPEKMYNFFSTHDSPPSSLLDDDLLRFAISKEVINSTIYSNRAIGLLMLRSWVGLE